MRSGSRACVSAIRRYYVVAASLLQYIGLASAARQRICAQSQRGIPRVDLATLTCQIAVGTFNFGRPKVERIPVASAIKYQIMVEFGLKLGALFLAFQNMALILVVIVIFIHIFPHFIIVSHG